MLNVGTVIKRPIPVGSAAAGGLVAFLAGGILAVYAPALIAGLLTPRQISNATVSVRGAGAELVTHNRSEIGLDVNGSTMVRAAGPQLAAHNRSERALDTLGSAAADRVAHNRAERVVNELPDNANFGPDEFAWEYSALGDGNAPRR